MISFDIMIFSEIDDDTVASSIETTDIELADELICINVIAEEVLEVVKLTKTSTRFIMTTLRSVFVQLRDEIAVRCLSSEETW